VICGGKGWDTARRCRRRLSRALSSDLECRRRAGPAAMPLGTRTKTVVVCESFPKAQELHIFVTPSFCGPCGPPVDSEQLEASPNPSRV
jgi:hypothetical protein